MRIGDSVIIDKSNAISHSVIDLFIGEPAHIISGNGRYVIEFDDPGVQQDYIHKFKEYVHTTSTIVKGWAFPSEWLFKVGD